MLRHFQNVFRCLLTAAALVGVVQSQAIEIVENGFQLEENTFNQWVYGNTRTSRTPKDAETEIAVAVDAVDRTCKLTDPQREKLRLAARGDYARFNQRVDLMREKYVDKVHNQNEIGRIHQEIQPLNVTFQAGLLGPSSLFAKSLHGILTPQQMEKYNAEQTERIRNRHDAKVRLFVAVLERRCPLTEAQRRSLIKLVLEETQPPRRSSQFDQYVVLVQVDRIPDQKLKAILDADQIRVLDKMLVQVRGLEAHLQKQGVLP
jgi:hypothetical protein